jgi:hypothetical protein
LKSPGPWPHTADLHFEYKKACDATGDDLRLDMRMLNLVPEMRRQGSAETVGRSNGHWRAHGSAGT